MWCLLKSFTVFLLPVIVQKIEDKRKEKKKKKIGNLLRIFANNNSNKKLHTFSLKSKVFLFCSTGTDHFCMGVCFQKWMWMLFKIFQKRTLDYAHTCVRVCLWLYFVVFSCKLHMYICMYYLIYFLFQRRVDVAEAVTRWVINSTE